MKCILNNKNNIIKFTAFIGVFAILIGIIFTCMGWNNDSLNKDLKIKNVDDSTVNDLVRIANLDDTSYPPFPFIKEGRIDDYSQDEKDFVIAYYARRMGLATKGYDMDIDVCSTNECYVIEENNYKKILETFEIKEYTSNNIFKDGNLYYFIFDDFRKIEGESLHNISATYGDNNSIVLKDEMSYSLFDNDKTKVTYIYNFKIHGNNEYSLSSIEKK